MRIVIRTACALVAAAALVATSGTSASAHECMVSSRSQQGEQAVGHSSMWVSEDMATHEAYAFTFGLLGVNDPTEEMLDAAVEMHLDRGLQRWASFFQGHTLLQNPKSGVDNPAGAKHSGDQKGVDHWSDTELGLAMFAIAAEVLTASESTMG